MDPLDGLSCAVPVQDSILQHLNQHDLNALRAASPALENLWPKESTLLGHKCDENELRYKGLHPPQLSQYHEAPWTACLTTPQDDILVRECQGPKYGTDHGGKSHMVREPCRIDAVHAYSTYDHGSGESLVRERMTPLCLDCAGRYRHLGNFRVGLCNCAIGPFKDWLCHGCQLFFQQKLLEELECRVKHAKKAHLKALQVLLGHETEHDESDTDTEHDESDTDESHSDISDAESVVVKLEDVDRPPKRPDQAISDTFPRRDELSDGNWNPQYASHEGFSCLCGKVQPWKDQSGAYLDWEKDVMMVCLCCYQVCESPNGINVSGPIKSKVYDCFEVDGFLTTYGRKRVHGVGNDDRLYVPLIKARRCPQSFETLTWPVNNPLTRTIKSRLSAKIQKAFESNSPLSDFDRQFDIRMARVEFLKHSRPVIIPADNGAVPGNSYWRERGVFNGNWKASPRDYGDSLITSTEDLVTGYTYWSLRLEIAMSSSPDEISMLLYQNLYRKVKVTHPDHAHDIVHILMDTCSNDEICGLIFDHRRGSAENRWGEVGWVRLRQVRADKIQEVLDQIKKAKETESADATADAVAALKLE